MLKSGLTRFYSRLLFSRYKLVVRMVDEHDAKFFYFSNQVCTTNAGHKLDSQSGNLTSPRTALILFSAVQPTPVA